MADAQPTMDIGSAQSAAARTDGPTQQPPGSGDSATRTRQAGAAIQTTRAASVSAEMQSAPTLPSSGGAVAGVAAWQSNKTVDSLWTINQDRNSWVGIASIGWKKLSAPSETAVVGLTMLMAHARATGSPVTYRDESDNLIHEVYVW